MVFITGAIRRSGSIFTFKEELLGGVNITPIANQDGK